MSLEDDVRQIVAAETAPLRVRLAELEARLVDAEGGEFLTPEQASKVSGYAPTTIRDWARGGRLTRYGTTGRVRVARAELLDLIRHRSGAGAADEKAVANHLWSRRKGA